MSVIGANDDRVWARHKRIERLLPASARVVLGRAWLLCRKLPRVNTSGRGGDQELLVSDGVLVLEDGCVFDGQEVCGVFKLLGRRITARDIRVLPYKARGSQGHHKFMVSIRDGVLLQGVAS